MIWSQEGKDVFNWEMIQEYATLPRGQKWVFFIIIIIIILVLFQEYFSDIEQIILRRWAKTRVHGEIPPDLPLAELVFLYGRIYAHQKNKCVQCTANSLDKNTIQSSFAVAANSMSQ